MKHMLHLSAEASLPEIQGAIAHARASRLGLAFPLGAHPMVADLDTLQHLYQYCAAIGKDVVIFGGDELLRAGAVTSGFFVATTLADWSDEALEQPEAFAAHDEGVWDVAPLRLLTATADSESDADEWDTFAEDEFPQYVQELLAADGTYGDPREQTQAIGWQYRERFYRRHPISEAELMRVADEYYEDAITMTIRVTGAPDSSYARGVSHLFNGDDQGPAL